MELPEALHATSDLSEAIGGAGVIVVAVPSHGLRDVISSAARHIPPDALVVSLSKGVERGTQLRMTQVCAEVLAVPSERIGVLTGPNLAKEILAGQPAASVVAIDDADIAAELQRIFSRPSLRVYTNDDVVGDRKSTRLNSSHMSESRMPSSA